MSQVVKTGYLTEDGKIFESKQAALDHVRRPAKQAAFMKLTSNNEELTNWMLEKEEDILANYESTRVRRVRKTEKKALEKALAAVKAAGDKQYDFLITNADAVLESFRWPSVKRGTAEEQAANIRKGFLEIAGEENVELVNWLIENESAVTEAYEAGKPKVQVSEKATTALAAYRAKVAAEKATKAAAEGQGVDPAPAV